MDEVFGENNFVNEIIWKYHAGTTPKKGLGRKHDTIFFYRKSEDFIFNLWREPISQERVKDYKYTDGDGRKYRFGGSDDKTIYYLDKGKSATDVWTDINIINKSAKERLDYPTQKPERLLERILSQSTNKNNIVMDFFAGSGTTLSVAEKLDRKWIGCDCGKLSIYTMQKRILTIANSKRLENKDKKYNKKPKAFTLYNAGLYDYQKMKELPWDEYRSFALNLFEVRDEKHRLSGIELDGFRGADHVIVFNHEKHKDVVLDYGYINDLHKNIGSKISNQFFIIIPAGNVDFMEDYIEKGNVRYYILRIPYSIINELHKKDFTNLKQPIDEKDINNTVEAVGFDFIQVPDVECEYFSKKDTFVVKIKTFKSRIRSKKPVKYTNKETLSAVMVDWDFNGEVFDLDKVYFADDIKKNKFEIRSKKDKADEKIMLIYMDIFGNEKKEIKKLKDFK